MSSEKGPKYIIITLEGIEKINSEKMTTKHSEEYFFCCE